eukprot:sb/3472543/
MDYRNDRRNQRNRNKRRRKRRPRKHISEHESEQSKDLHNTSYKVINKENKTTERTAEGNYSKFFDKALKTDRWVEAETQTNNDEINTGLRSYSGTEIDEPRRQKEEDSKDKVVWYLLVGHVVGLLGTEHPQASGTWWYVDDSPHLADLEVSELQQRVQWTTNFP